MNNVNISINMNPEIIMQITIKVIIIIKKYY